MVIGPDFARDMRSGEEGQVDDLLRAAFPTAAEATLVTKLRKARVIAGETVLTWDGQVIGYFALSKMVKPKRWLCLAPVAIHPEMQRRGYGKRMMGMLTEWARITQTPIVVLGNPDFYEKVGFDRQKAAQLQTPYPIEQTMLAGMDDAAPAQELVYSSPFKVL